MRIIFSDIFQCLVFFSNRSIEWNFFLCLFCGINVKNRQFQLHQILRVNPSNQKAKHSYFLDVWRKAEKMFFMRIRAMWVFRNFFLIFLYEWKPSTFLDWIGRSKGSAKSYWMKMETFIIKFRFFVSEWKTGKYNNFPSFGENFSLSENFHFI